MIPAGTDGSVTARTAAFATASADTGGTNAAPMRGMDAKLAGNKFVSFSRGTPACAQDVR